MKTLALTVCALVAMFAGCNTSGYPQHAAPETKVSNAAVEGRAPIYVGWNLADPQYAAKVDPVPLGNLLPQPIGRDIVCDGASIYTQPGQEWQCILCIDYQGASYALVNGGKYAGLDFVDYVRAPSQLRQYNENVPNPILVMRRVRDGKVTDETVTHWYIEGADPKTPDTIPAGNGPIVIKFTRA